MAITKWSSLTSLAEIEFSSTEFWVQIHGLASINMLKENAFNFLKYTGKSDRV